MAKTAEEIYDEKVNGYVRQYVLDFLDRDVDNDDLSEFLEEKDEADYDLFLDVREAVYATLDTISQRYSDDD